jgi:hypothetical protein
LPVNGTPRRREIGVGEALIRVVVGSVLSGVAVVVLGVVLKPPAMHTGSADTRLRAEHSRTAPTAHHDVFPLQAPIAMQTPNVRGSNLEPHVGFGAVAKQIPDDHVRVSNLEPHVGFGAVTKQSPDDHTRVSSLEPHVGLDAVTNEQDAVTSGSDAVTNEQGLLEAVSASGWWNESFDERFSGLATQEFPSGDLDFLSPADDDSRTAIYDIAAGTVHLPNGRKLEAHSGFGKFIDDPNRVHVKNRGATPPNVYKLTMRKKLFHGVRAIRLTPVDEGKMFGRDGMLAHSFLHGPNGQSNGCVAFRNYPVFLDAFLSGEVTRLRVVGHLESPPEPTVASGSPPEASDHVGKYAAAD